MQDPSEALIIEMAELRSPTKPDPREGSPAEGPTERRHYRVIIAKGKSKRH